MIATISQTYHSADHNKLWSEVAACWVISQEADEKEHTVHGVHHFPPDKPWWTKAKSKADHGTEEYQEIDPVEHGEVPPVV